MMREEDGKGKKDILAILQIDQVGFG